MGEIPLRGFGRHKISKAEWCFRPGNPWRSSQAVRRKRKNELVSIAPTYSAHKLAIVLGLACLLGSQARSTFAQSPGQAEFISVAAARPILNNLKESLPPDLREDGPLDAPRWLEWVQRKDREVRDRLIRGQEDTLANLLRFGVTFTKEYQIDDEFLARYGQSALVNSFAENRATDLIRAWMAPAPSEGLIEMRSFVEKHGHLLKTAGQRSETKKYLLANLARLRDEYLKYKSQPKDDRRYQLFQDRGISLDTNLWPDYLLDSAFRALLEKGLLKPSGVRRIAVVGPGLDFVNKEAGNDFYPPQTIQPFAVLDSLLRLKVAAGPVELDTFDISENVNLHIARIRRAAAHGASYTIQLPWNGERPMSNEYRSNFVRYWQKIGDQIGEPAPPIPVPEAVASAQTRAIRVRPDIVLKVRAFDLNVIYQRMAEPGAGGFDLVIATNVFLYYGAFEQSLARANASAMLRPGGFLISNDKLPDREPSKLEDVLEVPIVSSEQPFIQDFAFCYRRSDD